MSTQDVGHSVLDALLAEPVAWITGDDGKPWGPSGPHGGGGGGGGRDAHVYDARCAICRAGEHPDALKAFVERVLTISQDDNDEMEVAGHKVYVTRDGDWITLGAVNDDRRLVRMTFRLGVEDAEDIVTLLREAIDRGN